MIRAYDYVESVSGRSSIQSIERFNAELKLARNAVERVLQLEKDIDYRCPGCGSADFVSFFTKWDVEYFRCEKCGSIFAAADEHTLKAYQSDTDLNAFRISQEYQSEAVQKRAQSWHELINWISFRCYRYLGKNRNLQIISGSERYKGFENLISTSVLCGSYYFAAQALDNAKADIGLSFNLIQQTNSPVEHLKLMNRNIINGGLLFLSARIGTGFDILVLKEHAQIYPYEYVSLLSKQGIEHVLRHAGFEMLDYSTPGSMDVGYVKNKLPFVSSENLFVKSLISNSDQLLLDEFQRFLQKSGMSSYAHIVAKKVDEK